MSEVMMVTAEEVAKMLNVSARTVWRIRSAGALPPPVKLGVCVRWPVDAIRRWIEAGCPCPPAAASDNSRSR
jgi:predicted DNA-binding transcriptional regulator AlpA